MKKTNQLEWIRVIKWGTGVVSICSNFELICNFEKNKLVTMLLYYIFSKLVLAKNIFLYKLKLIPSKLY